MIKSALLIGSVGTALAWSYVRHIQLPAGPSRLLWAGIVFGHRGCRNVVGIPENTLAAFQYAASRGCGGVECDVRLSKDNEVVVFHDVYANGHLRGVEPKRRIDSMNLFELRDCAFTVDSTEAVRIPTLEEVILFCREKNMRMLIEVKEMRRANLCTDKVLDLYRRYPDYMYPHTTLISFNPGVVYRARRQDKGVAVCQLYTDNLVQMWLAQGPEQLPWILRLCPSFWDRLLRFVQEKVMPWVAGCSMVGPRYHLFTETSRRRWTTRNICMYLWGFEHQDQCLPSMRQPGVCVSGDDHHEDFETPKPPPNFDVFGDAERAQQRRQEEEYRRLRIGR